jgi:aspartyl/asparaginyl beta-hydroxylase (cupin superfamily)
MIKNYNNDFHNLSSDIGSPMRFGEKWNPIWIKFMGEYTGLSNNIPSLKKIAAMFPDVSNIYISIFYPGNTIIDNIELSRLFHKYNYGLSVPDNDIGLRIDGHDVKWKEKEGFIWDDTLSHSVWNHTLEPRILICADIPRELSGLNSLGSHIIHYVVQRTKHVNIAKSYLRHESVSVRS